MEPDHDDAALKEAARVAAMKRVATAKLAARTRGHNYELAALLVDAIYSVFPPPPPEPAPPARAKPEPASPSDPD